MDPNVVNEAEQIATQVGNPVVELALATLVLVPIIVIHGWCLGKASRFFAGHFALYTPHTPRCG